MSVGKTGLTPITVTPNTETTTPVETLPAGVVDCKPFLTPPTDTIAAPTDRGQLRDMPSENPKDTAARISRRTAEMNAFRYSTYSRADVKQVAQEFGFKHLADARAFIGEMILTGQESVLAAKDITPYNFDDHECLLAFQRSHYSDADVKQARDTFDFLAGKDDKYIKEYIGLKIVNGYESMLSEAGITQNPWDKRELQDAADKAGYTLKDALAARQKFDFLKNSSLEECREYIGLKVVNKYESFLAEAGIFPSAKNTAE